MPGERQTEDEEDGTVPLALSRALGGWISSGEPTRLLTWLDRELDPAGWPKRLPVGSWWPLLGVIEEARRKRPIGWPVEVEGRLGGLLGAALRLTRPDGSANFAENGEPGPRRSLVQELGARASDPELEALARRLFPARGGGPDSDTPLPAPSCRSEGRPLAVLRSDWGRRGDLIAVDARTRDGACRFELIASGKRLLGPAWAGVPGTARSVDWATGLHADIFEWSVRSASTRAVRTVVLLHGRRLALVAEEQVGPEPLARLRLALPPGVIAAPVPGQRALSLEAGGAVTARVLPLLLPGEGGSAEGGRLTVEEDAIVLTQETPGPRAWLPLLISWDPARNRRTTSWRRLTVAERSHATPPQAAVAARVAWGRGEGLVVYRSLRRPALRSFLGHQMTARFLIGAFTPDGNVRPLLTVRS